MSRRSRGGAGVATSRIFAPGIVTNGEAMRITRKGFIVPDEAPRPQGMRTMTVGRRTYSWSTARDVGPVNRRPVSETISEEDLQVRRRVTMVDHVEPPPTTVTPEDRQRYGLPSPVVITYSTVIVDENFHAVPGRPPKPAPAQRVKSAPTPPVDKGMTRDDIVRSYLDSKGLGGTVVEITPAIRAAALDAIAAERQMAEYLG